MIKTVLFYILTLILFSLPGLTGCGQENILSGSDRAAVLVYSETAMDNLFAGLADNDYPAFSRDFDSEMAEEISATDFLAWKRALDNRVGNYLSRQIGQVTQSGEFNIVDYLAKFEREEQVTVTVAFHAADHSIALLSFDSDKFSWSAFE